MTAKLLRVAALAAVAVLPAVALASGGGDGGEHHSNPVVDLAFFTVNLAILLFILVKFGKKPLSDSLALRRQNLIDAIAAAEKAHAAAQAKLEAANARLALLDKEIAGIESLIQKEAANEREHALEEARNAAARMMRDAEFSIGQQLAAARKELTAEASALSLKLAEETLTKQLNDDDRRRLVLVSAEQIATQKGR